MRSDKKTHRIVTDALLLGVAIVFSYVELLLPLTSFVPLPSFKIGLANVVIMIVIWQASFTDAAVISALRIFIMGIVFGNPISMWFSFGGSLFSLIVLYVLKKFMYGTFSFIGVSVLSAAAHNVGQVTFAAAIFGTNVFSGYLPFLLLISIFFGGLCGVLVNFIYHKIRKQR